MKQYKNYSELLFEVENSDSFDYVLYYENDFSVVRDKRSGRYICFEEGENDASEFFEVVLVTELIMPPDAAGAEETLKGLFDCVCCGEHVDSEGVCRFMWFEKKDPRPRLGIYECIKDWYKRSFPQDPIGELTGNATFQQLYDALGICSDIYKVIGVGDSVVRERCFERLAFLYDVDYGSIYDKWLSAAAS